MHDAKGVSDRDCGYCKEGSGLKNWGFRSHKMGVDDYQLLMDRGWRRSGSYYYKSDLELSCCLLHTIRLKARDFVFDSAHRRVIRKFNQYLNGQEEDHEEDEKKEENKEKSLK